MNSLTGSRRMVGCFDANSIENTGLQVLYQLNTVLVHENIEKNASKWDSHGSYTELQWTLMWVHLHARFYSFLFYSAGS